jgi:hypoxanthine phosphoribosyltransferase
MTMNKQLISWADFDQMCAKIADDVLKSDWRPNYIVGINRGGLPTAVVLSHMLEVPMYSLKVTLRDGVEDDCDHNLWMSEEAIGYGGMGCLEDKKANILIVDDINDAGATYQWIQKDWQDSCLPNLSDWNTVWGHNVRYAVLVNNLSSAESADFSALTINKAEQDIRMVFPWERQ